MLFKKIFYNSNNFTLTDKNFKKGTFGTIYIVKNNLDHLQYAAKFINIDENIDNNEPMILIQEFYKHSILCHPSIVKFDSINFRSFIDLSKYQPIVITEYFPNGSLKDIFSKKTVYEIDKIWNITKRYISLLGIADAMRYLHSHEIIHLNLKPENILLDENYYPKICDFGYSLCFPNMYYESMKTNISNIYYLPPEMITDEGYGKSVDVYAFSIIAYEIITGKDPYSEIDDKITIDEFLNNICIGTRPKITNDVTKLMAELLSKCWCHNSIERLSFEQIIQLLTTDINYYPKSVDLNEINQYIISVLNRNGFNFLDEKEPEIDDQIDKCNDIYDQFISAIESGNSYQVEQILSIKTFNINEKICISNDVKNGYVESTVLHVAIDKGNIDIIKHILKTPNIDVNIPFSILKQDKNHGFDGCVEKRALHIAIEKNNLDAVKLLLMHPNIDINAPFKFIKKTKEKISEKTALHLAVENENTEIVELLLKYPEIDINSLYRLYSTSYNSKNIGKIGYTIDDSWEKTSLHIAVEKNNIKLVQLLLERPEINVNILSKEMHKYECTEPKDKFDPCDSIVKTALYIAVEKQNPMIVNLLLTNPTIDVNIFYQKWSFNIYKYRDWDLSHKKCKDYEGKEAYYYIEKNAALHLAVQNENKIIVQHLLENPKLDINIVAQKLSDEVEYKNKTALHIALQRYLYDIAKLLLSRIDINANILCYEKSKFWINEKTALHSAILTENIDIIGLVLSKSGINPNIIYKEKSTNNSSIDKRVEKAALHMAAEKNNLEVIKLLSNNPLINVNILMNISEKNKEKNDEFEVKEKTPLHIAVERENLEIIQFLLANSNIDLNAILKYFENRHMSYKNEEKTALIIAIERKNVEIVKLLLSKKTIDINHIFAYDNKYWKFERTALHIAVDDECTEIVKILLEYTGINRNATYKYMSTSYNTAYKYSICEQTALHIAVERENLEIIKILLLNNFNNVNMPMNKSEHYVNDNFFRITDQKEKTALHFAIEKENHEIVQFLLTIPQTNINAILKYSTSTKFENEYEEKIPIIMAIKNKNAKIFNLLLSTNKFDVNKIYINNIESISWIHEETLLKIALENKCEEIVQILLAYPGIDVNILNKSSSTPSNNVYKYNNIKETILHYAVNEENVQIIQQLIKIPTIDINSIRKQSLSSYIGDDKTSTIENSFEDTALHLAYKKHNIEIIKILLSNPKIDPNISTKTNDTVLHMAIKSEKIEIIETLLDNPKIKVDSQDKHDILKIMEKKGENDKIIQLIS